MEANIKKKINCALCKKDFPESRLGLELFEGLICDGCMFNHYKSVIEELNRFTRTENFKNDRKLKLKLLWFNEEMFYRDRKIIEALKDYSDFNLERLQCAILDNCICLIQCLQEEGHKNIFEEERLELLKAHKVLATNILRDLRNKEE